MDVLQAFSAQALAVQQTLRSITPDQWDQPGLGEWSLAELTAHLVRAADRTTHYLAQPVERPVEGSVERSAERIAPACDRVSYFDFDTAAVASDVAARSRADAARIGTDALVSTFAAAWTETAEQVRARSADHLTATLRGPMLLHEYLATRVLELTVHHLDLTTALGVRPSVTDEGVAVTESILTGLLGAPRPEGMDPPSFILAATGREAHPDPRFPVLS
ncbi:maleylpyruvate isomerase N-terminal domain-containing protein [Euzebya tangerina]|uniref:maleylpyruvate isomerase N-terminal domain-containing protein n=1 Tax=Euzebya tangerina TaxID=591198 RepID=UPI0013C2E3F4|nr:maleylpyruvate isomerase N-terminal domain-containing protein [Euzebya tangerina]